MSKRFIALFFLLIGMGLTPVNAQMTAPKPLSAIKLAYPLEQLSPWKKYKVVLQFKITKTGEVDNVAVAQSSGLPMLDQSTVDAVKALKFSPALDETGNPVDLRTKQPFSIKSARDPMLESCASLNTEIAQYLEQQPKGTDMDIDFVAAIQGMLTLVVMQQSDGIINPQQLKKAIQMREEFVSECRNKPAQVIEVVFTDLLKKYNLKFPTSLGKQ